MSTTVPNPTPEVRHPAPATCPSWCTGHPANDEPGTTTHTTTVTVGTTSVEVEQVDGITPGPNDPAGAYVVPPEVEWIDGQDVHDLAAALSLAAQIVGARS